MGRAKHNQEERARRSMTPLLLKFLGVSDSKLGFSRDSINDKLDVVSDILGINRANFKKLVRFGYHRLKHNDDLTVPNNSNTTLSSELARIEQQIRNKNLVTVILCGRYPKKGASDKTLFLNNGLDIKFENKLPYIRANDPSHLIAARSWVLFLSLLGLKDSEKDIVLHDIHGQEQQFFDCVDELDWPKLEDSDVQKIASNIDFKYRSMSSASRERKRVLRIIEEKLLSERSFIYVYITPRPESMKSENNSWHCILPDSWLKDLKLRKRRK